jgi:hypothetical protein
VEKLPFHRAVLAPGDHLLQNKVGFYSEMEESHAFKIYVERIENAIAQENSVTLDTLTRDSNSGKQAAT